MRIICVSVFNVVTFFSSFPHPQLPDTYVCLPGQFKCTKNQKCIPINLRCNGQDNCGDEEDERDCRKSFS